MVPAQLIPNSASQLPNSSSNTVGVYHLHHMSIGTYSPILPSHPYIPPGHGMHLSPSYAARTAAAAATATAASSQNFLQNFSQNYVGNNYGGLGTQPSDLNRMRAFNDPPDLAPHIDPSSNYHQMTLTQMSNMAKETGPVHRNNAHSDDAAYASRQ